MSWKRDIFKLRKFFQINPIKFTEKFIEIHIGISYNWDISKTGK